MKVIREGINRSVVFFLVAREHLQQTMATGKSAVCATRPKKSLVLYPPVVVHAVPMTLRIQTG